MKVNAITIRPGNVLEHEGKLMLVTKIDLIQPGKGNAVIQVEMVSCVGGCCVEQSVEWRRRHDRGIESWLGRICV